MATLLLSGGSVTLTLNDETTNMSISSEKSVLRLSGPPPVISFNGFSGVSSHENSLSPLGSGDENHSLRGPELFEVDDDTIGMLYMARSTTKREGIKYATAPKTDQNNWTRHGMVVTSGGGGAWDEEIGSAGAYFKEGSTFYVFYADSISGKIGLASGASLASLSKHGSNPLIDYTASSNFDKYVRHPTVIKKDSTYYMFYDARGSGATLLPHVIGRSTSTDLINWTRDSNVVIDSEEVSDNWSTVSAAPQVRLIGSTYVMFFYGGTGNTDVDGGDVIHGAKAMYATSPDLETWTVVTEKLPFAREFATPAEELLGFTENAYLKISGSHYLYCTYFDTSSDIGIGRGLMSVAAFDDDLPTSLLEDDFAGSTIDAGVWEKDADVGGITITQNERLQLNSDGAGNQGAISIRTIVDDYNQDYFAAVFSFNRIVTGGTDGGYSFIGFSDGTQQFGIERLDEDESRVAIYSTADGNTFENLAIGNNQTFKILLEGRECRFYYWNPGTSKWKYLYNLSVSDFKNHDFDFRVALSNMAGRVTSVTVDNLFIITYEIKKLLADTIIVMEDDFAGSTIDTAKWTTANPDVATVPLTQNDELIFSPDGSTNVSYRDNKADTIDSINTGVFSAKIIRTGSVDDSFHGIELFQDADNYAWISKSQTTKETKCKIWVFEATSAIYSLETGIDISGTTFKIYYDGTSIFFYYWDGVNWVQMGNSTAITLTGLKGRFSCGNNSGDSGGTVKIDNAYLTSEDYTSEIPL